MKDVKELADNVEDLKNDGMMNMDLAFDGMWSFSGYCGMMVQLAHFFVESKQGREENKGFGENDEDDEDEFLFVGSMDISAEETIIRCQENLEERNLHMADGVLRRLVEGCCPPKIRITRLDEDTLKKLIDYKVQGNHFFGRHEFREAIDFYDLALSSIPETQRRLYIAPRNQIQEIVNVLSNKAECLLRKVKYEEAAETATDALIFMADHEKSRIRRAKAGLEIGKYDRYEATSRGDGSMTGVAFLVQSKYDLEEVLNAPDATLVGRQTAEEILHQVDKLLKGAKKKVLSKDPNPEWDLNVLKIQSRCW
ncbi:unnamed protein product [Pseudo-nitzschia multistriata]|uniref:Uncharacterized protein n=1 Tax=Pseudo-nitzschia multistriata TaxID=183589 RepID=A0A448ZS33_9STRA|nr:unnamed protein product [Pseudo-nitzschia multistriata]